MKVCVIFACDRWKSVDSMRMIMVSSVEKLKENLKKIQQTWEYSDDDMNTYIYTEEVEVNRFDG